MPLLARLRSWPLVARLVRYASVSVVATAVGLTSLTLLVTFTSLTPGWANVVATALGTVPSFELNRRWVWSRGDRRSLTRQVAPFVVMAFVELAVSTVAVQLAAAWADRHGLGHLSRTVVVDGANIASFGLLWVAQYVLCDRVLFRAPHRRSAGTA